MTAYLPRIQKGQKRRKQTKSISFELGRSTKNYDEITTINGSRGADIVRSHGNESKEKATMPQENAVCRTTNTENVIQKQDCSVSDIFSASVSENDQEAFENFGQICQVKECDRSKTGTTDESLKLRKLLREKDRELSRLQEVIRKMASDRERAVCSNANSRMRIVELKNKLSGEYRKVEHVTNVERLRSKQKVSSETERLRQERDEARAQLAQHETLVWQLRKQAEQLGYVGQQRYKTIQELGKKMAAKDKSLQELRKRMEQAQLIQICTGGSSERRPSVSSDTRHVAWETPGRLATVNEKVTINKS